jgi:hypothetical protein
MCGLDSKKVKLYVDSCFDAEDYLADISEREKAREASDSDLLFKDLVQHGAHLMKTESREIWVLDDGVFDELIEDLEKCKK